jgi:flavin reductase (DIM6/NTAB) family NADH-FMN oxidoreductase RutF
MSAKKGEQVTPLFDVDTFDSRQLRDTLGRFTTGVCVVTTHNDQGDPVGLTVNSFAAVSLEPPLVLWSLQLTSDAYQLYADARRYAINVLSMSQQALSDRYAMRGGHILAPEDHEESVSGLPLIADCLGVFECEQEAVHPGGDHIIIVGRVKRIRINRPDRPLLFYGGTYGGLA